MRRILALYVAAAMIFGLATPAGATNQAVEYDCRAGSEQWHGWLTAPDLKVAGNYCPANGNASVEGSWATMDRSSNGLCAEAWVSPAPTAGFQRVPGTKACGIGVVRIVSHDPVPLSYVYRTRVVETYPTCPPLPRSCWADSGFEIYNAGYDPD
jgi:hypothetical protein